MSHRLPSERAYCERPPDQYRTPGVQLISSYRPQEFPEKAHPSSVPRYSRHELPYEIEHAQRKSDKSQFQRPVEALNPPGPYSQASKPSLHRSHNFQPPGRSNSWNKPPLYYSDKFDGASTNYLKFKGAPARTEVTMSNPNVDPPRLAHAQGSSRPRSHLDGERDRVRAFYSTAEFEWTPPGTSQSLGYGREHRQYQMYTNKPKHTGRFYDYT